jgi:hypothetical protein
MRLSFTLLFASIWVCHADEAVSGRWEGSVQIPAREVKFVVDLAQDQGGAWIGSIIVPGLDLKGAPLVNVAVKDSDASFALKSGRGLEASFKAHLSADGTLAGDFVQAGNTAPFVLKKIGLAQVERPLRSTAIAKELEGEWKGEYEALGYPRHVTVKLVNHGVDGATAEFVVVGKKVNNLPVDLVTQEGDLLTIDSHETGISYEGRFQKDEIKGTFTQVGIEVPLVLRRSK